MICSYVYKLIHYSTGEFYIGYRYKNIKLRVKPENDIGVIYFTSSKYIKPIFRNFNIEIIAEFFSKDDAYDFEQELIKENIDNILCLNRHYQNNSGKRFKHSTPHSEAAKQKMRGKRGKINRTAPGHPSWNTGLTKDNDDRLRAMAAKRAETGNNHQIGQKYSNDRVEKIRNKLLNRQVPDDQRLKMSIAKKGKTWEDIFGIDGAKRRREQSNLPIGKNHFNSKSNMTPNGVFETIKSAAQHFGVCDSTIVNRCNSNNPKWKNWYFLDTTAS
ncbi:grpIintron_endo, group I intron endonuclease [uncultured Caudovirales phage]|uniref:GrpIintron_endo, group I intron endonuclease n=1 Tax=uncultured Caudovirales phage TaxID=2100421 RepID=A0A6J5LCZ1_9CAUD|nr:grpIintron_endo, group I intron endonuclease [uncultured Caudovirales phage]